MVIQVRTHEVFKPCFCWTYLRHPSSLLDVYVLWSIRVLRYIWVLYLRTYSACFARMMRLMKVMFSRWWRWWYRQKVNVVLCIMRHLARCPDFLEELTLLCMLWPGGWVPVTRCGGTPRVKLLIVKIFDPLPFCDDDSVPSLSRILLRALSLISRGLASITDKKGGDVHGQEAVDIHYKCLVCWSITISFRYHSRFVKRNSIPSHIMLSGMVTNWHIDLSLMNRGEERRPNADERGKRTGAERICKFVMTLEIEWKTL